MVSAEFLKTLPENPGVYIMKNKNDKIIYVGKAKILRNRVRQYFQNNSNHTAKVRAMVSNIDHIEYIVTNSETEALNLECSLIKKHRPKYNILLKDDKGYPYIKITNEQFPQIMLSRTNEKDGSEYFGPYISSYSVKYVINILRKVFKIRECKKTISLSGTDKPCLNYHIGRCTAPCAGKTTAEEYNKNVSNAIDVLNGKTSSIIKELSDKMYEASEKMDFETAASYRDRIKGINKMMESQLAVSTDFVNEDIICLHKESGYVCIQLMFVRDGKLIDKKSMFMNNAADDEDGEIMTAFLTQYYSQFTSPDVIYTSVEPENREEVEKMLSDIKKRSVHIKIPQRGDKYKFILMARKNASEAIRLKEMQNGKHENTEALRQLKEYLSLDELPQRIEAYDISNTAGEQTVASMVVFRNGLSSKADYRKFKIKTSVKSDDYGAMKEVIKRRFLRVIEKKDEKFSNLPDLIFVDGGKGQVNAAQEILRELGIYFPVYGIIKDDKHRTRDIVSSEKEYNIPVATKCFKLMTDIQDEMHRVAITYHRHLRAEKNTESELMKIPGIGKAKYKNLMQHFKTIGAIKSADVEELMKVKGINKDIAESIEIFFKKS